MMGINNYFLTFLHFYAFSLQQVSEPTDLLLQLSDQLSVTVLVDHSFADNLLRPEDNETQLVSSNILIKIVEVNLG